jgi:hypothetical protein
VKTNGKHPSQKIRMYNKLEDNFHLSNKKALLLNMKTYYEALAQNPFLTLPMTFHIQNGVRDSEMERFNDYHDKIDRERKTKMDMKEIEMKKIKIARRKALIAKRNEENTN